MAGIDTTQLNKDVSVDQMDYSYIDKCSNEKELAKILRALRSGKEGFYPKLIEFCENKLRSLNPEHRALRKEQPIKTAWDLGKTDHDALSSEMENWSKEMSQVDQETSEKKIFETSLQKSEVNGFGDHADLPPIRGSHVIKGNKKKPVDNGMKPSNPDRIKSYDYKAWDKFDVEKECEKVDKTDKKATVVGSKPVDIPRDVNTAGLTEEEKEMKAVREKEKGNEAFKSGDFEEALSYYCRSISLQPIAASYNNRALVFLRLEKWKEAVIDCNKVLSFKGEGGNLKAKLRRATAYKSLERYDEATSDLLFVLEREPNNARAKSILEDVEKLKSKAEQSKEPPVTATSSSQAPKQGKRMVITEVEGDSSDESENSPTPMHTEFETPSTEKESSSAKSIPEAKDSSQAQGNQEGKPSERSKQEVPKSDDPAKLMQTSEKKGTDDVVPPPTDSTDHVASDPIFPEKTAQLKSKAGDLFKSGQYAQACENYTKAIDSVSSYLKAENVDRGHEMAAALLHNNRAACWLKQGNDRACIEDCNEVLRVKVWDVKAFLRRATAYENLEKYAQAWADYQSAHSMDWSNQFAQNGANRVGSHLREMYGSKWREKVPKLERYPHHSGRNLIVQSSKVVKDEVQKNEETAENQSPPKSNAKTFSTEKEEQKSNDGGKPPESDTHPKENKKKKNKNKKRSKSKSKAPQDPEKVQDKDSADMESRRMKIREDLYQKLKLEGNDNVKKGNYQAAIDCYTRCLPLCPKETASYTNRALCFLKLKKHVSAIQDCTEAIKLDPVNVKAYYRRAQARKEEGFIQEAEEDIKKLLEIDPSNKAARNELDALRKLLAAKSSSRPTSVPKSTGKSSEKETQPVPVRKKQMVIEEVDSSSSSDEAEFVLPTEENTQFPEEELKKMDEPKIVVLEDNADHTPNKPEERGDATESLSNNDDDHTPNKNENSSVTSQESKELKEVREAEGVPSTVPTENTTTATVGKPMFSITSERPLTPYEFGNLWSMISNKHGIEEYRALLNRINPKELPSLLSNKIDDHIICAVAKIAFENVTKNGDFQRAYDMMSSLTKAQRFSMAAMFLSSADKRCLQTTFDALTQHAGKTFTKDDVVALQAQYCM